MVDILQPEDGHDDGVPLLGESTSDASPATDDGIAVLSEEEDELPAHAVLLDGGRVLLPMLHKDKAVISYRKAGGGDVHREEYPALTFRRLHGADMRAIAAAGKGADPAVVAIARSTGIHVPKMHLLYDAMDAADVTAASQVVAHFLGNGPKTGR